MLPFPQFIRGYLALKNRFLLTHLRLKVAQISGLSHSYEAMSDAELQEELASLRDLAQAGSKSEPIEVRAFATIREAARRCVEMYPHEEQLLAALLLNRDKIVQMDTGEGKTLVAPFHAILESLYGRRVIVVTANEYLASRDYDWMAPLYRFFGIRVSLILDFYDHGTKMAAYSHDVIYVSNDQLVFDYLRKQHTLTPSSDFPIPQDTAIIDEIDNVFLDQGTTQFSLVNPVDCQFDLFPLFDNYVQRFSKELDFTGNPITKELEFTNIGHELLGALSIESNLTFPEVFFYTKCALSAHHLYAKDKDYLIADTGIVFVDTISGRPRPGSHFPFGVQQAIELKEGLSLSYPRTDIDRISLRGFYSTFERKCGMSGSAVHNALEFRFSYGMDVVPVPPHHPSIRALYPDVVYRTVGEKLNAAINGILQEDGSLDWGIRQIHERGLPVLVGTATVEEAQQISTLCRSHGLEHRVLTARNHFEEAAIIRDSGQAGRITIVARMAGRGVDIKLDEKGVQVGGLHVLGFGRREDRRIDEQLVGRCARQGDPGSARFFLSLEDDLLRVFGGKRVQDLMRSLGMDEGVPVESKLISRRINAAQKNLTLGKFYQRQSTIFFNQFVDKLRFGVFGRRRHILRIGMAPIEIAQIIERSVSRAIPPQGEDLLLKMQDFCRRLRIAAPDTMYRTAITDAGAACDTLRELIGSTYQQRRNNASPYSANRERLIFVRSIDLSWSQFLDEMDSKFRGLMLSELASSSFETKMEFARMFTGLNQNFFAEVEDRALFYFMRIDDPAALREIKYWRGLGILYGETTNAQLEDGIEAPENVPKIYEPKERPSPDPESAQSSLDSGLGAIERSTWDYIQLYIADLTSRKNHTNDLERIKAILQNFGKFLIDQAAEPEGAIEAVPHYLASLEAQGIPFWVRRKQKKVLAGFFRYLQRRNALSGRLALTIRDSVGIRLKGFGGKLAEPVFILKLLVICIFASLYRVLTIRPIPYIHSALRESIALLLHGSSIQFRFVDQVISGGALSALSLSFLGAIAIMITRLLLKSIRRDSDGGPLILCFPVPIALAFLTATVLTSHLVLAHPLSLLNRIWVSVSLIFATCIIAAVAWTARYVELPDGLSLVFLLNGLFILYRFYMPIERMHLSALHLVLFSPLAVSAMFFVYRKYSFVSLTLVEVGKFDFHSGHIKMKPAHLYAETMFGPYHYMYALLVVILFNRWISKLGALSVWGKAAFPHVGQSLNWQLAAYVALACWFSYRRAILEFNPDNIRRFLETRNWLIENAKNMSEGVSQLVSRVRLVLLRNWLFETAIITFCLVAIRIIGPAEYMRNGNEEQLLLGTLMVMSGYILLNVLGSLASQFSDYTSPSVLAIPTTFSEDNPDSWARRIYEAVTKRRLFVEFIVAVYGLIEFLKLVVRFVIWVSHKI